jgi:hypothetical protein
MLGLVKRLIGGLYERFRVHAGRGLGQPRREGAAEHAFSGLLFQGRETFAYVVDHADRGLDRRVHQDDGEFLAAVTADHVGAAQALLEQAGQIPDHPVAGGVSMAVVHLLEVVDIDHPHRQHLVQALRPRHLGAEAFLEAGVVEQAGEAVPHHQRAQGR